ncbi:MAG: hypothetical protein ACTTI6_09405 [Treponema sp.]|uniref:hypothetical protein n=1 Tax=Treponema sp. TaxID=166 RepID=UPI003FA21736
MTFAQLCILIKNVIISPEVIIITVLLILYLNLVFYVVRYHKPQLPSLQSRLQQSLKKPSEQPNPQEAAASASS